MYRAKNGLLIEDNRTKWGWKIKTAQDIATALQGYPAFATVAEGAIWRALSEAVAERRIYADIEDLGRELAGKYI